MGIFDTPWTAACATWFRIKFLLLLAGITTVISIGFSAWQTKNSVGSFKTIGDMMPNFNWNDSVCTATPYVYLSPFQFTFSWNGKSYNTPSYCPWPVGNTTFRLIVGTVYLIFNVSVFWETAFSRTFASPLLFLFALLWYSSFVVDAQSLTASTQACTNGFGKGTVFTSLADFTLVCDNTSYGVTVALDLLMFFLVFIIWRAWGHCPNRWNKESLAAGGGDSTTDDIPDKGLPRTESVKSSGGGVGDRAPARV